MAAAVTDLSSARMSAAARRALVEASEGRRLVAYRDCVGVWTIGFGHTSRSGVPIVRPGLRITDAQADSILADDLAVFEKGVAACLINTAAVAQREFDAMVDLAFNIGLGAFKSSSLLRHFRAGRKDVVENDFLAWNKAGGHVVSGLTKRREAERQWFKYGHLAHSTVQPSHLLEIAPEDMPHEVDHADGAMMRLGNRIIGLAA